MKIVFSTKGFKFNGFREMCDLAYDYGCAGFEIYDAKTERKEHPDSIFRPGRTSRAKKKLVNSKINISALTFPYSLDSENATPDELLAYVKLCNLAAVDYLIVNAEKRVSSEKLSYLLTPALKKAEMTDTRILFETSGYYSDTNKVLHILRRVSSASLGVCWSIRDTYFEANESAEDTIRSLGAYVEYVRLGDRKGDTNVILGEGDLPVEDFIDALNSLNYESFICIAPNDEIDDTDILLTHFASYLSANEIKSSVKKKLYYNRTQTGTFPYKRFDILDKTFSQVLDDMANTYPDQYAIKYTTLDYMRTYKQFRRDVDTAAAALISIGVKPGHHVAVWATNIPEWFLTFWATTKIGAVLVTVNTAYKINEIEYLLRQSDTHTLVMIDMCRDISYRNIIEELCPELKTTKPGEHLYSKRLPFLRNVITVGFEMEGALSWKKMLLRAGSVSREEVYRRASMVKPSDVANMQYTSGTTGFPKGVMLTHSNIINNGKIIGDRMDLSTADRMMIQVPMFHCFGMVLSMTSMMTHGGTISPLPYYSPKSSLACINLEHITCFNGVPTMFIGMFSHEDFAKTDFSYMRTGIMAGANCPPELMRKAAAEMNMKEILSVYGQTEASPGCTMGDVNEDLDHRVETVGSAFPGIECKIINPETGEELPDGESGEFVVRGFNVMKGYYKMPKATKSTIDENGWLHSGDICTRTSDGYYKVTGRLKDMIIRGGENIYPREIEEFYLTSPKIKDASVIGVKDKRYGEEACIWIILNEGESATEDEMKEFALSHIATHKVPKYFVFTDSFPMNAAGKILKYKMKEISEEKFGL